jgi:DNA-binding transcriptional MocR family regulator
MDLHVGAHSPSPIRRLLAEPLTNVIEGGGLPRSPALPSIPELADSSGINPNAVTRAIEDLKRSGYRPLRTRPAALQPLSMPGAPPGPARHGVDGEADSMPGEA